MIVGIDNGLDGGLCAISKFNGTLIDMIRMPTKKVGKKREVDTKAINKWLLDMNTPFQLAIEEPLAHAKSSQAIRSMALSFGKLLGMAECHNYPVERVTVREWQKTILGRIPKGMTKPKALEVAMALQPDEDWLATPKSKVPHDGMIDAYLIAHYFSQK